MNEDEILASIRLNITATIKGETPDAPRRLLFSWAVRFLSKHSSFVCLGYLDPACIGLSINVCFVVNQGRTCLISYLNIFDMEGAEIWIELDRFGKPALQKTRKTAARPSVNQGGQQNAMVAPQSFA